MSTPNSEIDYYSLLEIDRNADNEAIGHAVRSQRRRWVTRQNSPSLEKRREAEDRLVSIAAAETALLDPSRRQAYDSHMDLLSNLPPAAVTEESLPAQSDHRSTRPPAPERHDWLTEGRAELKRGDLRSARYSAQRATELNQKDDAAWALLAQVSMSQSRWDDAYVEITRALRCQSAAPYYAQLGEINLSLGSPEDSAQAFRMAGSLDPSEPGYDLAAAQVWLGQNRPDLALQILEPLHDNHPQREDVARSLAYALSVNVDAYITTLHDGTTIFTSPGQIERARLDLQRAHLLNFDDLALRQRIDAQLQQTERSAATVWLWPQGALPWIGWIALAWISYAIFLSIHFLLGLIVLAGVIALFVKVHRVPGWQRNKKRAAPMVRSWGV